MNNGMHAGAPLGVAVRGGAFERGAFRLRARSFWLSVGVALAVGGCASTEPKPAFDPQLAKTVNTTASEAAVAKPGTKVCRWVQLGIAERDLVRGIVQQSQGSNIRVRIEDAGRFPNSLNGHRLGRGETISDAAAAWTPCTF